MLLTRLLYVSDRVEDHPFDADQMLSSAIANNRKSQITGALWYTGTQFIQVLEGGPVAEMREIAGDHGEIRVSVMPVDAGDAKVEPLAGVEAVKLFAWTHEVGVGEMDKFHALALPLAIAIACRL